MSYLTYKFRIKVKYSGNNRVWGISLYKIFSFVLRRIFSFSKRQPQWLLHFSDHCMQVTSVQDVPPPVVDIGPTNQTLATRSAATLPCQASGIPLPTIKWYRNGNYLSPDDPRVTITSSGTLQIDGEFLKVIVIFLRLKW